MLCICVTIAVQNSYDYNIYIQVMVIKLVLVYIIKKGPKIQNISLCTTDLNISTFTNMVDILMMVSKTFIGNFIFCSANCENQCP